ncbi:hypothetical protein ACS0TY_020829 [Phlomoides rotata]
MISYIMKSLLLILALALMNSQARTLTDELKKPSSVRPAGVVTPLLDSFIHKGNKPPPPPQSATPVIEMVITGGSSEGYVKKGSLPPPAPKDESPTHPSFRRWSGGAAQSAALISLS